MHPENTIESSTQSSGVREQEQIPSDPLALDIDDAKLAQYVDKRVESSKAWYKSEKDLYNRQKKNEDYLFGRQIDTSILKPYNARYVDNLIYESEATIKPIALSKFPDLYVTPGGSSDDPDFETKKQEAKKISDYINSDIKQRENRRVLSVVFKHIPVGFMGAIKHRWNPAKGMYGDYEFYVVHYSRLVVDHDAKSNDPANMDFICEYVDMSVKEITMRFPEKKDEFLRDIGFSEDDQKNDNKMATKFTISEVHFKWYEDQGSQHNLITSVLWKYKKIIFHKMKSPNWDWQGRSVTFTYDTTGAKKELSIDQLRQSALGQSVGNETTDTVYKNYLDQPEFPYILLGYDQFGTMPYDETSRIEQVIYLQDNVNKRGKQITEIADRAKGKHILSAISGLKKEDVEEMDMDDPDVDLFIQGKIGEAHAFIPAEQPSAALFDDQEKNRQRIFQKMGVNSTTRGQKETDVATTAQILRESDFGRIDDIVEDTINYAAEKMARAILQYIKLRYTENHFKNIMGKDGSSIRVRMDGNMIQNGMDIIVHASAVDKMMRKREAYELMKMKAIDPLTFYEDIDAPNPKERVERLLMLQTNPQGYMTKYIYGLQSTGQMAQALQTGLNPQGGANQAPSINQASQTPAIQSASGQNEAQQSIQELLQGLMPQPPAQVSPEYLNTIEAFIKSAQFMQAPDESKQRIIQYAQSLTQQAQRPMMTS